jgi:serine/threonine-protein kinase
VTATALGRFGAYELVRELGARGLFAFFEAKHVTLGRRVEIATVALTVEPRPALDARLERYARALAKLPGDAVFGLFEITRVEGRLGVVVEAPTSPSLRTIIDNAKPLSLEEGVAVGLAIARAVAKLHKAGVAHLALAPEYIHFTADGVARLAGLFDAGAESSAEGEVTMPEPDGPDAPYRAPERAPGSPSGTSADVFSLGVILFELLSGALPFEHTGGAGRIRGGQPPKLELPMASLGLAQTVFRALERAPLLRYEHAGKLADELESLLEDDATPESIVRNLALRAGAEATRPRTEKSGTTPLSTVALRFGAILAAMIVVFAVASLASGGGDPARGSSTAASAEVRILAHPWAEVLIDGERYDTTPIGKPALLHPGRHELTFRHPNAPEEKRVIDVGPGQRTVVDVEMEIVHVVDAGVDPSP